MTQSEMIVLTDAVLITAIVQCSTTNYFLYLILLL